MPGAVVFEDRPALRAQRSILGPAGGHVDPDNLAGRLRRPGDQRILGVRDNRRALLTGRDERLAPLLAERVDLVVTVELVAAEVQHDQHLGMAVGDHVGHHLLVDLENRNRGLRTRGHRGDHPFAQVRAVRIGHHIARIGHRGPQRCGQQVRRGGLAVGARDHADPLADEQFLEVAGVDAHHQRALDGRTAAASAHPGGDGGRIAHRVRDR